MINLLSINGRFGRLNYFLGKIYITLGSLVGLFLIGMSGAAVLGYGGGTGVAGLGILLIISGFVFLLASFIGNITITIRRFHDFNQSGFIALILYGIVLILSALVPPAGVIFEFILFVVLLLIKGTDGHNSYGPDPTKPFIVEDNE